VLENLLVYRLRLSLLNREVLRALLNMAGDNRTVIFAVPGLLAFALAALAIEWLALGLLRREQWVGTAAGAAPAPARGGRCGRCGASGRGASPGAIRALEPASAAGARAALGASGPGVPTFPPRPPPTPLPPSQLDAAAAKRADGAPEKLLRLQRASRRRAAWHESALVVPLAAANCALTLLLPSYMVFHLKASIGDLIGAYGASGNLVGP
jgi:hypothetical protein